MRLGRRKFHAHWVLYLYGFVSAINSEACLVTYTHRYANRYTQIYTHWRLCSVKDSQNKFAQNSLSHIDTCILRLTKSNSVNKRITDTLFLPEIYAYFLSVIFQEYFCLHWIYTGLVTNKGPISKLEAVSQSAGFIGKPRNYKGTFLLSLLNTNFLFVLMALGQCSYY